MKEQDTKGQNDETSVAVEVLGGILSNGVGHTHMQIHTVHTCIHTKALLKVFITLSYEMKILI